MNMVKEEVTVYRIQKSHSVNKWFTTDLDKAELARQNGCSVTFKRGFRWKKVL